MPSATRSVNRHHAESCPRRRGSASWPAVRLCLSSRRCSAAGPVQNSVGDAGRDRATRSPVCPCQPAAGVAIGDQPPVGGTSGSPGPALYTQERLEAVISDGASPAARSCWNKHRDSSGPPRSVAAGEVAAAGRRTGSPPTRRSQIGSRRRCCGSVISAPGRSKSRTPIRRIRAGLT